MAKIYSIGIGPGISELFTQQSLQVLTQVDSVIGFHRPIQRIKGMLDGKEIYSSGPNQENQIVEKALEIVRTGKDVAVISEGDSGIYGLGVLLQFSILNEKNVEVIMIPGLPEFVCGSALIGTPLADDFCVINISTRLKTPENLYFRARLIAQTDLTTIIYYPAEKESIVVLKRIVEIFSEFRPPDTNVAIVKKAFRNNQEISFSKLESILIEDMGDPCNIFICSEDCKFLKNKILGKIGYLL
ncbi:precorrin-3B C(17)-methyltransferase [candidate division KSB1 bacterium]|nr:precorrin-3B C(17)-methyltransferase [candidate division KSB1 bacterium]